jgi:protein phosphatase
MDPGRRLGGQTSRRFRGSIPVEDIMMHAGFSSETDETDTAEYLAFDELVSRFYEVEPRCVVQVDFGARTHPGNVRPNNEDNYLIVHRHRHREIVKTSLASELLPDSTQDAYTLAVADGMGGQQFGEVASMLALRSGWDLGGGEIKWSVKMNPREAEELANKARVCFQLIHRAIKTEAERHPRLGGMGTTLTVAYSVGPELFVIHAGDSRAYLDRGGRLRRLTRDHNLAQHLIETGQAEPGSPEERRVRHVLINSLGMEYGTIDVDVERIQLQNGDRLLLCTDGLTDMANDTEIEACLARHDSSEEAAQALLDLALERGGKDNVTIVIGRYHFQTEVALSDTLPGLSRPAAI